MINTQAFNQLKSQLTGSLLVDGQEMYDQLRFVFNKAGKPAAIVRCANVSDVTHAVKWAVEQQLEVSVRSGGHGMTGSSTNDGGVVIDLSLMRGVEVLDEAKRLVKIQPGATWGEVAEALGKYGWALTAGDASTVGVGGLASGGGIGWMVRKFGLTIDAMQAVEIVTANGEVVRASDEENPDLFWAVRGAGANFGVITSFEFAVQEMPQVIFGSIYYRGDQVAEVVKGWAEHTLDAPRELSTQLMLVPPMSGQPPVIMMMVCYADSDTEMASKVLEPLLGFGQPFDQRLQLMPYSAVVPNHGMAHFRGGKSIHRTQFIQTFTDELIEAIAVNFGKAGAPFLQLRSIGGAMSDVPTEATAFAHRDSVAMAVAMTGVSAGYEELANTVLDRAWQTIEPYGQGAYVNFVDGTDEATARRVYPESTYKRLVEIKKQYDPQNIFRNNVNIKSGE